MGLAGPEVPKPSGGAGQVRFLHIWLHRFWQRLAGHQLEFGGNTGSEQGAGRGIDHPC